MYGYNAEPPIAIPIYTVLPYCVILEKGRKREKAWNKFGGPHRLMISLYKIKTECMIASKYYCNLFSDTKIYFLMSVSSTCFFSDTEIYLSS